MSIWALWLEQLPDFEFATSATTDFEASDTDTLEARLTSSGSPIL